MGGTLVVAELSGGTVRRSSLSAISFARQVGQPFAVLVLGTGAQAAAKELAAFGAQTILVVDDAALENYVCERFAPTVAQVATGGGWDTVVVAATAFGKDLAPRVASILGAGYAPDIDLVKLDGGRRLYRRPMCAGNVLGWLEITSPRQVVSVRQTAFAPAEPAGTTSAIEGVARAPEDPSAHRIDFVKLEAASSERPDLAEARIVVAGGRALKEQFMPLLQPLADALGAAIGASRAACDAGYAPPELQVGQTGRTVAPQLYIAIGISGAIQHVAGMKASKVIVAINKDGEAPIFQIADYGLVGDLFSAIPELVRLLSGPGS
jgi:electron transfer flavoprotein alpha subunit